MLQRTPWWGGFIGSVVVALIIASGCASGGGGCGGCPGQGGTYVFPADRIEQRVVKARMTQAGLDFLRPRLKDLIKAFLGVDQFGRVRFAVPEGRVFGTGNPSGYFNSSLTLQAEPNGSNPGSAGSVSIDFSSLDVQLIAGTPPKMRLSVRGALVDFDLRMLAQWQIVASGDAACYVRGDVARGTPAQRALLLDLDIDMTLEVDQQSNFHTTVSFPTLTTRDFNIRIDAAPRSDPFCADGLTDRECDLFCGAGDLAGNLVTGLRSFLGGFIDGALRALLPTLVQTLVNGRPLKFQGQLDLAGFLGGVLPSIRSANKLGYLVQPGPDGFVVDGTGGALGLNLALNGGLESSPTHPCVTAPNPMPLFTPGAFPALSGLDSQGRPYHVGLTFADAFLNEGGVAAYTSGALCINLGSNDLYSATGGRFSLNSGALALLVPGLRELAGNEAPVLIGIVPTSPPKFKFGSGAGTGEMRDSLIDLEMKGMHLSFYTLIGDRMARLFEFNADIDVGLTIVVLPDNKLQVAVDRVKIDKLTETYNELFRSSDLQSALRLIVNLATSALLGQGISFSVDINSSLPAQLVSLMNVRINEIARDGSDHDYLTLTLTFTEPMRAQRFMASTRASLTPGEEAMAVDMKGKRFATGRIALDVSGRGRRGDASDLEFQYRLDGGPWSGFHDGPRIYVDDARLLVIGTHTVEVRSRVVGSNTSLDARSVTLQFVVDPLAPRLALAQGNGAVRLDADDERTPRARIDFSWRMDDGAWGPFLRTDRIPMEALPSGDVLEVRARDEAGNVSDVVSTRLRYTHGRTTAAGSQPGCGGAGCTTGGMGGASGNALAMVAWLAVAALLLVGRKRKARGLPEHLDSRACARRRVLLGDPAMSRATTRVAPTRTGPAAPNAGSDVTPEKSALFRVGAALVAARNFVGVALLVPVAILLSACGDSTGATCTADAQCPDGFRCTNKKCEVIPRCDDLVSPSPCCPGQLCSAGGTCIDVIDRCDEEGLCGKPGKVCSAMASGDGGSSADGICSYKTCSMDDECTASGGSCFNGFCRLPTPCNGGCDAGKVCVTPTDECITAPVNCQAQTCDAGRILVFNNVAAQIGARCDLAKATCTCAEIPQIARGDWGRDSRIAVLASGSPVVSAYDKTYGDLVLASYSATGTFQKLEYVDGVPPGERATGRPSGIRGGVTAPGPDVGRYTSVAIAQSGAPIIAYYDVDNADLKFAAKSGDSWRAHTVDSAGDVGRYTHVVVGPDGKPSIVYFQKSGAGTDLRKTALKIARAKNQAPASAGDWDVSYVDSLLLPAPPMPPCAGACTQAQVCIRQVAADGGAPVQRCVTPDATPTCNPACPSTQSCVSARCEDVLPTPAPPLDDLPEGVGLFPSLAFSSSGIAHIAYYDRSNGNLKGARAAASNPVGENDWQKAVVDGTPQTFVEGDIGLFPSLAFMPDGKLAIAYEDATNDDLVLYIGTGFTGGAREVVDRGTGGVPLSLVGADAALAIGPGGAAFVAYQDSTFNDLKLASRTGPNLWTTETVLSEGAWGFYADLVISAGKLYMSSLRFGFDENAQPRNEVRVVVRNLP